MILAAPAYILKIFSMVDIVRGFFIYSVAFKVSEC